MDYATLNARPARDFLKPENFRTDYDSWAVNTGLAARKYQEGLEIGQQANRIYISGFGTWGARLKSGAHLSSYEGIGYHAGTGDLLRGFLDSGCAVVVHRAFGPDAGQSVLIK